MAGHDMKFSIALPTDHVSRPDEFVTGDAVMEIAAAIEAAGLDACFVTDHPAPDAKWLGAGGHHALEPTVALSFAAAATTTLAVHTHIYVLAYRNPFLAAKAIASLDQLSGGRSIIGIGPGIPPRRVPGARCRVRPARRADRRGGVRHASGLVGRDRRGGVDALVGAGRRAAADPGAATDAVVRREQSPVDRTGRPCRSGLVAVPDRARPRPHGAHRVDRIARRPGATHRAVAGPVRAGGPHRSGRRVLLRASPATPTAATRRRSRRWSTSSARWRRWA